MVADHTITTAQFQLAHGGAQRAHELFVQCRPRHGHGGEVAPFLVREAARTVGAERTGEHVAVGIVVDHATHSREECIGFVAVAGSAHGGVVHIPVAHRFGLEIVAADVHIAAFALRGFVNGRRRQRMIAPFIIIGEVVGGLQHEMEVIGVAHAVFAQSHAFGAEAVVLRVAVVHTVCGGEGETVADVEFQVETAVDGVHHVLALHGGEQRIGVVGADAVVGVVGEGDTVGLIHVHRGRIVEHVHEGVARVHAEESVAVPLDACRLDVGGEFEPRIHLGVHVGLRAVAFVFRAHDNALALHVVGRHVELRVFVALAERELIILRHSRAQHHVLPVDTRFATVEIGFEGGGRITVELIFGEQFGIFARAHHFGHVSGVPHTDRCVEGDERPAGLTAFGLDEHHAVGAAAAVDGGRRGVFEHLHAGDVFGVDAVETVLAHHAVDDIERFVGVVDRAGTAHADLHTAAGDAAVDHLHTAHATLQGVAHAGDGLIFEGLGVHHGHRAGQIGLAHRAVADDHGFVERVVIGLEGEVQLPAVHRHFLAFVADVRHLEHSALFGLEGESAFGVGGGALGGAFHADGHTGEHFAVGIDHRARHLLARLRFLGALCGRVVFIGRCGGLCAGGKKETQREG